MRVLALFLVSLAALVLSSDEMPLVLLKDSQGKNKGAVCLDGTNPGFYYRNGTASTKWVLYFKGGGWCYNEPSCAARSRGELGSSTKFPKQFTFGGVLQTNTTLNPDFATFNHVILWYCDGMSFSGARTEPYPYVDPKTNKTTLLYFRGKQVLDALLDVLLEDYGMRAAEEVLLSGGSAGGLSTYLHADHVRARLPSSVRKYKAAPVSGFFLLHDNYEGKPLYPGEMQYAFHMQNASAGVNQACLNSVAEVDQWRCVFANYSYAHTKTPMFPLQSAVDAWQMGNIWQGDKVKCVETSFEDCTPAQIADLNGYATDLMDDFKRTTKFSAPGEGGFVESCLEHVAAQGAKFNKYKIGGVVLMEALGKWWRAGNNEPSSQHWYLPCELTATTPHQCNPSCGTAEKVFNVEDFYNPSMIF